ncbi:GATA zinc finger domain-containing protein [Cryptosporidium felis]|nr:GATA zinc finger domain-containing protein [Cryptosporidium felis]
MSNLNNIALQLVQILNQHTSDGGPQGLLQANQNDPTSKLLLEQYNNYLLSYLSRPGGEQILNNLSNQASTSIDQTFATYQNNATLPINSNLVFDQTEDRKAIAPCINQDQMVSKQSVDATSFNPVMKPTQILLALQQNQSPLVGLQAAPLDATRSQVSNSSPQQVVPLNVLNPTNLNGWAETALSSLLDKPDMLMNLMRLGAASIMASYYGQAHTPTAANVLQQGSPFIYNMGLSPKQTETPCISSANPLEMSTSSMAYTPVKSPSEVMEHQTPVFTPNTCQQFSDELVFYNFLEQSRKLSSDIKSQNNEKKNTSTNKSNGSSIRKSCAGRPRLDRSDWCCSLCRCIETAQWRYLRNNMENNQNNICHRGKILVCNACYLRVSKENKIRQKINTYQIEGNVKLDDT